MTMLPADFASAFPGESELIEFKQGLPENKIREAVVAFSNADGGVILLGVRDDGNVQGLDADGDTIARIQRRVRQPVEATVDVLQRCAARALRTP